MKDDQRGASEAGRPPLPEEDAAVAAARALISERAGEARHHVASSLLTGDGRMFTALNLESVLPQAAVCAEPGALSMAFSAEPKAERIVFAVAVNRRGEVIPPCGLCRELMLDHAPDAMIAVPRGVPGASDYVIVPLKSLLPMAYKEGLRG